MGSSRENSPDWLRCFKAPTQAPLELSSDSEPSPVGSPSKEERSDNEELSLDKSSETVDDDENLGKILSKSGAEPPSSKRSRLKSPRKGKKVEDDLPLEEAKSDNHKKRKGDVCGKKVAKKAAVESPLKSHALNRSVWTLSSDSELTPETSPTRENHIHHEESSDQKTSEQTGKGNNAIVIGCNKESPSKKACKDKPQKKGLEVDGHASIKEKKKSSLKSEGIGGDEVTEEEAPEKQIESQASSARLPLMLSDKVQRSKALVECEGGSIDLGGDMGAVGRVVISDTTSGDHEMYLDLKGTIYKTTIVPSRTFCVVSFGQSEAKIEAIMNDFIQLKPQSNVFEAETMVEGTLDGFSFDSDEEAEKLPKVQQTENDEDVEEKTTGKRKGKAEKTSGVARKRGKTVGGKAQPQKKVKRKAQVSKKTKTKK